VSRHSSRVRPAHPAASDCPRVRASRYEIRLRGRVRKSTLARFEGFDAEVEPAETVLRGQIADQAALHGLFDKIEGLGLELVEVKQVGDQARPTR
jgi:hypothetical protein